MNPQAIEMLRDLLKNRLCSCGGWKCARCRLAVKESRQLIRRFDKRMPVITVSQGGTPAPSGQTFQQPLQENRNPLTDSRYLQNMGIIPFEQNRG